MITQCVTIGHMVVLIYARVSTNHHDQNPEIQLYELRRYCAARGWQVKHEIVDRGVSGGTDVRPGLKEVLSLARSRKVDAVVVLKLDRLFRSLKHLVTALDEFQALGIHFVAVKDNLDYSTPSGRFFVQVLGSLAEFEKELLRERTILGLEHARRQGKRLGRPIVSNPGAIRGLRKQGMSYMAIAQALNTSLGTVSRVLGGVPKSPPILESANINKSGG